VGKTTRIKYLEAILRQECAWFDLINYDELSAKIVKECQAVQEALGNKAGMITYYSCMSIGGFIVGVLKGW
jgi:ATP-binding cassette, subfamily B (MDR/TAP), member 1